jgi:hypothetical protein
VAFVPKEWRDAASASGGGGESTPLTAAALRDLETRLSGYTDSLQVAIDGRYRQINRYSGRLTAAVGTSSTDFIMDTGGVFRANNQNFIPWLLWLDPATAHLGLVGRTTKYRLRGVIGTTDTVAGSPFTFTLSLYSVTAIAGATTTANLTLSVVAASSITFTTPAADAFTTERDSGDFTAPSAGPFVVGIKPSAAMAANSNAYAMWELLATGV